MDTPFWVNSYLAHRSLSKSHISPQIQHPSKGPVHWPKNVVQGIFLSNSVSRFADDHCKLWDMTQTGIKNSDLKNLGIQVQQWINMKDGAHLLHSPRAQTIHVDTWLQLQGQWQIVVLLWIWSCAAAKGVWASRSKPSVYTWCRSKSDCTLVQRANGSDCNRTVLTPLQISEMTTATAIAIRCRRPNLWGFWSGYARGRFPSIHFLDMISIVLSNAHYCSRRSGYGSLDLNLTQSPSLSL